MAYRRNMSMESEELAELLAVMRAVYLLHQAHHWQTRGPSFYGDHLMFQRLYETLLPEMDSVAERVIARGFGPSAAKLVGASAVTAKTQALLNRWAPGESPESDDAMGLVIQSLDAEITLLGRIDSMLATQKFSNGVQNLLQGIADKHEENTYLLQRRMGK